MQSEVRLASTADVDAAVASASAAWAAVARLLASRSARRVLFAFRELLNARKSELAEILTSEHGKVLSDALGEIARGMEVVEFACGLGHLTKGAYSENVSTGIDVYTLRQPLGVVGIISPFNFPAMVPLWFFSIALAAGNAVILKPSEKDPTRRELDGRAAQGGGPARRRAQRRARRQGGRRRAARAPRRRARSRSSARRPIAQYVYETATGHGKRVQALGGAKNHMLVLPDADLDLAADAAVNAGFGSAGERCMAISVVLAVDTIADEFVEKVAQRMATLRTGDGTRGCDMGPLITEVHRDKVASYIDVAASDGASVVVDGRDVEIDGDPDGFWLGPTLIDKVPTSSSVYTDEIFGPVLSVVRVDGYEEGLGIINCSQYGNGTAIFTNDGGAARRFQREVQVGMIGINVPIPVPVAYHSFGGWKASLFGDAKAYGPHGFDFFTQEKAITSRWLDPSHGGLNLGFPQHD